MVRKHKNDFYESETNVGTKDEKVEEQSDNTEKEDIITEEMFLY